MITLLNKVICIHKTCGYFFLIFKPDGGAVPESAATAVKG